MTEKSSSRNEAGPAEAVPHYHGHRARLRERLLGAGSNALADYELLELVLFRAIPRRDVKPLAKSLIEIFGSFSEVIAAPRQRLAEVEGLGDAGITELKVVEAAAHRFARGSVKQRHVLSSWSAVLDYCRAAMAFADREQFRILFLDKRNQLIADEVQQTGTVDHTPVYPREVVKRALELSATAVVLVHNHSSSFPIPLDHERSLLNTELVGFLIEQAKPKLGRANAIPAPVAAPRSELEKAAHHGPVPVRIREDDQGRRSFTS